MQIRKLDFSHGNPSTRANLFDSFLVWNKEVKKKNAQRNVINKYFVALYVKSKIRIYIHNAQWRI